VTKMLKVVFFVFIVLWFPQVKAESRLQLVHSVSNPTFSSLLKTLVADDSLPIDIHYVDNDDLKIFLLRSNNDDVLPDVLIMPNDHLGLPLDYKTLPEAWFQRPILKEYIPGGVKSRSMGIPVVGGNQLVLFYNKRFVQKPIGDLMQLPEIIGSMPDDVDLIRWSLQEPFWFQAFFSVENTKFFEQGQPVVDTEAMWRGLERYKQFIEQTQVDTACDYSCAFNGFIQGKVAYIINGEWAMNEFESNLGDDLGVTNLPTFNQQRLHPYFGSRVLALPGNKPLSQAQIKILDVLINGLLSPKFQMQLWQHANLLPVTDGVATTINDPVLTLLNAQIAAGSYMPEYAAMAVVWASLSTGLSRYLTGIMDERETSAFMQKMIDKTLREQSLDSKHATNF
jgi:maltose-binding protein MalE